MPASSTAPPSPGKLEDPVGLRILGLFGYPLDRAGWVPRRSRTFFYPLLSASVLLAVIYGIGALLAAHEGVLHPFLASALVPALLIVTGWSAVWISWAASVYRKWEAGEEVAKSLPRVFPMVHLGEESRARLRTHWARLSSLVSAARYAVPVIALVVAYLWVSIYLPAVGLTAAPAGVRLLYGYPNQSFLMFAYLAAVGAILADVGAYGLFFTVEHLRFVSEFVAAERARLNLSESSTVRQLFLAQRPLQELAYASFMSSMAWFGTISVLVLVFVLELNLLTAAGLIALMVFALYVFLAPQWEFHLLIRSAKTQALARLEQSLGTDWYDPASNAPRKQDVPTLVLAQNVAALSDWHVDVQLVIAQAIASVFPIVAAVVGSLVGVRLG